MYKQNVGVAAGGDAAIGLITFYTSRLVQMFSCDNRIKKKVNP